MGIKINGNELTFPPNQYKVTTDYKIGKVQIGNMTVSSSTYKLGSSISQLLIKFSLTSIAFIDINNYDFYTLTSYGESINVNQLSLVNTYLLIDSNTSPTSVSCSISCTIDDTYLYMTINLPTAYTGINRFFGQIKYNNKYLVLLNSSYATWNMSEDITGTSLTKVTGINVPNYFYCISDISGLGSEKTDIKYIQTDEVLPLLTTGDKTNIYLFNSLDVTQDLTGTSARNSNVNDSSHSNYGLYSIISRRLDYV